MIYLRVDPILGCNYFFDNHDYLKVIPNKKKEKKKRQTKKGDEDIY